MSELRHWTPLAEVERRHGKTAGALWKKTRDGTWVEYTEETKHMPNAVWTKAPDGRLYISLTKLEEWIENGSSQNRKH